MEKTKEHARKESKSKVGKPIRSSNQYSFHKLAKERHPHEMQDKLLETLLSLPERNRGKRTLEAEFIAAKKNDVAKKKFYSRLKYSKDMETQCSKKHMTEGPVLTQGQPSGVSQGKPPYKTGVSRPKQFSSKGKGNSHHDMELECLCIHVNFFFSLSPKRIFKNIQPLAHF